MNQGAINKKTSQYTLPNKAEKSEEYECPDCNKDLILCKGKKIRPYFRHKNDKKNPCQYYTNPTEAQIHKDAKFKLKKLIETKNIKIKRKNSKKQYIIPKMCENSKICIEHSFKYNDSNKFADVAYVINNDEIEQIYEVCNTHKTKEADRPEPWFEFDAKDIIELSKKEETDLELTCIRYTKKYNKYSWIDDRIEEEDYCVACNNFGISYWSDGCYGPCWNCNRGDNKSAFIDE